MAVKKNTSVSDEIPPADVSGDSPKTTRERPIQAFTIEIEVSEEDIDALGHANNASYVRWMEQVAWAHSKSLGIDLDFYRRLQRAMVVRRHELDYLAPSFQGDRIRATTWISRCDDKFLILRNYRFDRLGNGTTLLKGATTFVCIDLETGRPKRMPVEFVTAYGSVAQEKGKIVRPG